MDVQASQFSHAQHPASRRHSTPPQEAGRQQHGDSKGIISITVPTFGSPPQPHPRHKAWTKQRSSDRQEDTITASMTDDESHKVSRTLSDSSCDSGSHAGKARRPELAGKDAGRQWRACLAWGQHAAAKATTLLLLFFSLLHLANYAMDAMAIKEMWRASRMYGGLGLGFLLLPILAGAIAMAYQQQHVLPGRSATRWLLALVVVLPANLACLSILHLLPLLTYGTCQNIPTRAATAKSCSQSRKQHTSSSATQHVRGRSVQGVLSCWWCRTQPQVVKPCRYRLHLSAWAFQAEIALQRHRPACIVISAACQSVPMAVLQFVAISRLLRDDVLLDASAAIAAASALAGLVELTLHSKQLLHFYRSDRDMSTLPITENQTQRAFSTQVKEWVADAVAALVWVIRRMLTYQAGVMVPVKWQQRSQQKVMLVPLHELVDLPYVPRCMVLVQAVTRPHVTITNSEHPQPSSSWKALSTQRANNQPAALLWLHAGCSLRMVGHLLQAWPVAACMHQITLPGSAGTLQVTSSSNETNPHSPGLHARQMILALRMHAAGPASGPVTPGLVTCCHTLLPVPLTELQLHAMKLQLEVLQVLGSYLQSPTCTVHTISLRDAQLSGVSIKQLCSALAANSSVTSLDLSSNQLGVLGPRTPQDILAMLKDNTSLQRLNLSYAGLGSEAAAEVLLGAASSSSLTSLDLSQNRISDCLPAALLLAWPPRYPPLTHLNLGFNWVQDMVAPWLLVCLTQFPKLTHFWMDYNSAQLGLQKAGGQARMRARRPSLEDGDKLVSRSSLSLPPPAPGTEPLDAHTRGLVFVAHLTCMPQLSPALQQLQVLDLSGLSLPEDFKSQAPKALRCSWLPAQQAGTSTHLVEAPTPAWVLPEALCQQLQQTGTVLDLDTAPWHSLNKAQLVVAMYTVMSHQTRLLITNAPLQHAEQRRSSMQGRRSMQSRNSMQGSRRSSYRWTPAGLNTGNSGTLALPPQQVKSAVEKLTGLADVEHALAGAACVNPQAQELVTVMACVRSDTSSPGVPQPPSRQATTQVSSLLASSSSYLAAPSGVLTSIEHEQGSNVPIPQLPVTTLADHQQACVPVSDNLYVPSRLSTDSNRPAPSTPAEPSQKTRPVPAPCVPQGASGKGLWRESGSKSVSAGGWKDSLPASAKFPLRVHGGSGTATGVWASQEGRSAFGTWSAVAPSEGSTPSTVSAGPSSPAPHLAARAARTALLSSRPTSVPGAATGTQSLQGRWVTPPASPIRIAPASHPSREGSAIKSPKCDDSHMLEVHAHDDLPSPPLQLQHAPSSTAAAAPATPRVGAPSMHEVLPREESCGIDGSDSDSLGSQPEDIWVSYASRPAVNSAANALTSSTMLGVVALPEVVVKMHDVTRRASRSLQLNRVGSWDWSDNAGAASGTQVSRRASQSPVLTPQDSSSALASSTHASAPQQSSATLPLAPHAQKVAITSREVTGVDGLGTEVGLRSISFKGRKSISVAPQGATSVSFDWQRASLESLQPLGSGRTGLGASHLFQLAAAASSASHTVAPSTPSFPASGRPQVSVEALCTSHGDGTLASIGATVAPAERDSAGSGAQATRETATLTSINELTRFPMHPEISTEATGIQLATIAPQFTPGGSPLLGWSPVTSTAGIAAPQQVPSRGHVNRLGSKAYQQHGRSWSQALGPAPPLRQHELRTWAGHPPNIQQNPTPSGASAALMPLSRVSRPSSRSSRRSRQYAGSSISKLHAPTRGTIVIGHYEANSVLHLPLKDLLLPLWAALTSSWAAFEAYHIHRTMFEESDGPILRPNPACKDADVASASGNVAIMPQQQQASHVANQPCCIPDPARSHLLPGVLNSTGAMVSALSPLRFLPRWYHAMGPLRLSHSAPIPEQPQHPPDSPSTPVGAAAAAASSILMEQAAVRTSTEASSSGRLLKHQSASQLAERNVQVMLTSQLTHHVSQLEGVAEAGHKHVVELHLVGVPESQDSALDALMQLVYATHPAYVARYSVQLPRRSSISRVGPRPIPPNPLLPS